MNETRFDWTHSFDNQGFMWLSPEELNYSRLSWKLSEYFYSSEEPAKWKPKIIASAFDEILTLTMHALTSSHVVPEFSSEHAWCRNLVSAHMVGLSPSKHNGNFQRIISPMYSDKDENENLYNKNNPYMT